MQQPELGKQLTALRKQKNLTQEELVEKSHVSVRTIQRIEAGEVMPRLSTIKILVQALGVDYETFLTRQPQVMETQKNAVPMPHRNTLLFATLAGAVYLVSEIILTAMNVSWITGSRDWGFGMNTIFASMTVVMVASYILFARGFIVLSHLFENALLKIAVWLLIVAITSKGILDLSSLTVVDVDSLWLPYGITAVILGAISIVFGIALIRLQDSMGELARLAGILEIVMGCTLITVVLFFFSYVIMVPALVLEILVLYRGYEYLSKSPASTAE
jgi:transcriptional regulator with XRE-family HTH domain